MGKNISKNLSSKHSQKFFDYVKQSATDALKTASKIAIQKNDWNDKVAIKLQKPRKLHHRKIQKQMKKKYLYKDMYLQNWGIKLMMTED